MRGSSLRDAVADSERRQAIASDAVDEVAVAIDERGGLKGTAAKIGLDTINTLRPGFLQRHIAHLLPGMAAAIDPYWSEGEQRGDAPGWLDEQRDDVAEALLGVTDAHVDRATDSAAVAVYQRLRKAAPERVAEQMPRIASFVERHLANGGASEASADGVQPD